MKFSFKSDSTENNYWKNSIKTSIMTPPMRKLILSSIGATLLLFSAQAQLDTKHWIPPFYAKPGPGTGTTNIQKHFVSLSTPSDDVIPVTIKNGYGEIIQIVEISRDAPMEYTLGPIGNANTNTYPLNVIPTDSLNMAIRSQGLYFESFQPFFVNMRHKSGSQGTSLTSKGQIALGTRFYSGHLYTIYNTDNTWNLQRRSHFISVMATQDNTTVTFDMIKAPISYIGQTPGEPITVTLDAFESYVIGVDHGQYDNATINNANGTRITSNKPIACNTGSWLSGNQTGQCIGSDQIVPAEITGQEYVLVKGLGDASTERPMVVATADNTEIFINGNAVPAATLNEGEFYFVPTTDFSANDNLYILATEKVYMYQSLSGSSTNIGPTVGLNFIPPLNCIGAKEVNLPFVNSLAAGNGQGRINIITKAGTSVFVNGSATPLAGGLAVPGINDWITYAFNPPTDNIIIESDSVMNVALLTRDNNVGTASYFSGFTLEPVVGLSSGISGTLPCIPGNALLQVFGFDAYQWYFNGEEIVGATGSTLYPEFAGNYAVDGIDLNCGFRFRSNAFAIPFCPSTLGAAKQAENVAETAPGSKIFDVTYRIFIENLDVNISQNIQVLESINGGLPVGATAELIGAPNLVFGFLSGGINPAFNGTSDRRLLPGTGALSGNTADAIDLVIRVDMNNALQDGYFDQVTVTSKDIGPNNGLDGPFSGQDFSHTGSNPDPNGNGEPNEASENDPTLTCFFTHDIAYSASTFCSNSAISDVTVDGVNGGVFESNLEGLELDSETGTINPALSTPGTYTVTFTTQGRCPTVTSTEVTIIPLPTSGTAAANSPVCITENSVDLFTYLTGGDANGTWTDGASNTVVDGIYNFTIPGNYSFIYSISTPPCDVQSTSVNVIVVGEPIPGVPASNLSLCSSDGTADLLSYIDGEQTGGQWFDFQNNPISNVVDVSNPGLVTYTYQVSNATCGSRTVAIELMSIAVPETGVPLSPSSACIGESIDLNDFLVGADIDGDWTNADGQVLDDLVTVETLGEVEYTYTIDRQPCTAVSSTVVFDVVQGPNPGSPENPVALCLGGPAFNLITLMNGADAGGTWTDGDGNTTSGTFNPSTSGAFSFTYTVTNEECGDISATILLDVSAGNCIIPGVVIPQGFSPNGDGNSDQWIITGINQYPNNILKVFNRWGAEIFTARPYQNTWEGTADTGINAGETLPVGTYWYVLDLGDGSSVRTGYVYLNR